jgi:hypothetical protein
MINYSLTRSGNDSFALIGTCEPVTNVTNTVIPINFIESNYTYDMVLEFDSSYKSLSVIKLITNRLNKILCIYGFLWVSLFYQATGATYEDNHDFLL